MSFGEESDAEQGKQNFKYNGKELDKTHGLNQYDYVARFMDPSMIRFTTVDPHAENYFSWSPYAYVGNNPMKLVDSDGKDWRDKLAAGALGLLSNALPNTSAIRDVYTPNDKADYNRMLKAVDDASTVMGAAMTLYGTISSSGGGSMMLSGATVSATGIGAPEGAVVATTGAVVWGLGEATAFSGIMLMSNAQKNASDGYDRGGTHGNSKSSDKGTLSETKEAVKAAQEKVGGPLPKGKPGKMGSPQRGDYKKGYRLDSGHPNRPVDDPESGPHVNWWDYTNGKRGSGGESGAIPIKKEK